jgi:hypothetical protein
MVQSFQALDPTEAEFETADFPPPGLGNGVNLQADPALFNFAVFC